MSNSRVFESHQIGKSGDKKKEGAPVPGNPDGRMNSLTSSPVSQLMTGSLKKHRKMQSTSEAIRSQAGTEAIVITDMTGHVVLVDAAALRILFQATEQLTGKTCEALLCEGRDCPHQSISQENPVVERVIRSRPGGRRLNIRVNSFVDPGGHICGFLHTINDVTDERDVETDQSEVERMSLTGLMVSLVAHEVATPLSVIANIAEMLLLDSERGSSTAVELNKIVIQARRVSELTRRMLDLLRSRPARYTDVDLAELACETIEMIGHEFRRALIQVSVESNLDMPLVRGDRDQLQQVLLNLASNAIQAMKGGGFLVVRIGEAESRPENLRRLLLTVEDTGPGISPQTIDRVFDFFFTTRKSAGGTGLGLAISKQIIEGHGGTIRAENNASGGARLSIGLPATIVSRAAAASSAVIPTL